MSLSFATELTSAGYSASHTNLKNAQAVWVRGRVLVDQIRAMLALPNGTYRALLSIASPTNVNTSKLEMAFQGVVSSVRIAGTNGNNSVLLSGLSNAVLPADGNYVRFSYHSAPALGTVGRHRLIVTTDAGALLGTAGTSEGTTALRTFATCDALRVADTFVYSDAVASDVLWDWVALSIGVTPANDAAAIAAPTPGESGLIGYYTFTEGAGATTADQSTSADSLGSLSLVGHTWGPGVSYSVDVSPSTATGLVGGTVQLTATVTPSGSVVWSSSDVAVATVDAAGLVTVVGLGTATITATRDGGTETDTASVVVPGIGVTPEPEAVTWSAVASETVPPIPLVLLVENIGGGGVLDSVETSVSYPAEDPTGWLTASVENAEGTWEVTLAASPLDVAGDLLPARDSSATVTFTAAISIADELFDLAPIERTVVFRRTPDGPTAAAAPRYTPRRADGGALNRAKVHTVDRTDIVSCHPTTGLCTATVPVATEQTVTMTCTSGGQTHSTRTFTVHPHGTSA